MPVLRPQGAKSSGQKVFAHTADAWTGPAVRERVCDNRVPPSSPRRRHLRRLTSLEGGRASRSDRATKETVHDVGRAERSVCRVLELEPLRFAGARHEADDRRRPAPEVEPRPPAPLSVCRPPAWQSASRAARREGCASLSALPTSTSCTRSPRREASQHRRRRRHQQQPSPGAAPADRPCHPHRSVPTPSLPSLPSPSLPSPSPPSPPPPLAFFAAAALAAASSPPPRRLRRSVSRVARRLRHVWRCDAPVCNATTLVVGPPVLIR